MPKDTAEGAADATSVSISELSPKHRLYSRLQPLQTFYRSEFGASPQFFVRVPGRVNLIGEHVDYCGYPVLPMAIEQCILLAVGSTEENTFLQLRNVEAGKFDNFKTDLSTLKIELPPSGGPEWYNYYLCGVQGIYETLGQRNRQPLIGMTIALSGNIPPASGLSSSSALVSAAALATAHVHRLALDRKRLASISASCERYIGTEGGGMDQAIAYLGKTGCAQFIEFHPQLSATPIQLPTGACFVIANSLAEKNKAASSDFNERVVECRLGARLIAKRLKCSGWSDITRFAHLQAVLQCSLDQLEQLAIECLPQSIYTRSEICAELGVHEQQFENEFLTPNTRDMTKFKLRQRTIHVLQESLRVCRFRSICEQTSNDGHCCNGGSNGNASSTATTTTTATSAVAAKDDAEAHTNKKLTSLSQLMRQSHSSLKDLYECSHPDLDRLVAISDALGVGARLTGAGWGGCVVALCCSIDASAKYIRELKAKYYSQLPGHILEKHRHNDFDDVVFATFPREGAEIISAASPSNS